MDASLQYRRPTSGNVDSFARAKKNFANDQVTDPPKIQDVVIIIAATLEWLPAYLLFVKSGVVLGDSFTTFSFTRYVIAPLLLFDLVREGHSWQSRAYDLAILAAYLGSLILPAIQGYSDFTILLPLIINGILFFYLAKRRTLERLLLLLKVLLLTASIVPLFQVLGSLNVIPVMLGEGGISKESGRVFSVVRTAIIGIYSVIVVSSLGGRFIFALRNKKSYVRGFWLVFSPFLLVLAIASPLLAAQRSSILVVSVIVLLGTVELLRRRDAMGLVFLFILSATAFILIGSRFDRIDAYIDSGIDRVMDTEYFDSTTLDSSAYARIYELKILAQDMAYRPFTSGMATYYQQVRLHPHTFLGYSFYNGGFVLLGLVLVLYFKVVVYSFRLYTRLPRSDLKTLSFVFSMMALGTIGISFFLPVYSDRLAILPLALFFSFTNSMRFSQDRAKRVARSGRHLSQNQLQ